MTAASSPAMRDTFRALLTCLALAYPFVWVSRSWLAAGAALGSAALCGSLPEGAHFGLWGVAVRSGPTGTPCGGGVTWWLPFVVAAAALGSAAWRFPRHRAVLGYAAACWAFTLLWTGGEQDWFPGLILAAGGVAALGFRWMAPAIGIANCAGRSVTLAAVYVASIGACISVLRLADGFGFGLSFSRDLVPLAIAAAAGTLGSKLSAAGAEQAPARRSWRPAAAGAVASLALFTLAMEQGQAHESPARQPPLGIETKSFFRGVNLTAERGAPYGSPRAREILEQLPAYGIDSIALVPYAGGRLDSPDFRFPLGWESDSGVAALAAAAHALGMRVVLKPQLWVRGGFPGDLDFGDDADLSRFFENYRGFVEHYARLAAATGADVFCIGVEFQELTRHEARWREVIAVAREHYQGPLTYAANFGKEFESIGFWDALDYIGLDNYYPLPDDLSAAGTADRIARVYSRFGRPVLFTEAGFSSYERAHERPWDDRPGGALSVEAQARFYEAFFQNYARQPWLRGIFWWKVGANGAGGPLDGSHLLWEKPAMDVLRGWYLRPPAAPPGRVPR